MTRDSLDPGPGGEGHDAVVHHVQGGQVAELLPGEEEEGVEEVHELGEEVPPGHVRGVEPVRGVAVVHWLAQPVVLPCDFDMYSHIRCWVLSTYNKEINPI